MDPATLFILLLLLACPLMHFMHRGGHGDHASHVDHHGPGGQTSGSLDVLRRRRTELDAEIAKLERAETDADARVAAGRS